MQRALRAGMMAGMTFLRRAPLLTLLLTLGVSTAQARVRLGELLPQHPWAAAAQEVVVVYSHDCGDLGELWQAVLAAGLPVRAVNAEGVPSPAPAGVQAWGGRTPRPSRAACGWGRTRPCCSFRTAGS
ncbi:hypothetical protein [Deinococcus taeanensis]|uniref:hypothetical protein n=1 Tax=Deinococcus taeanensis TaxID=2737050 RepID=UPI0032E802C1